MNKKIYFASDFHLGSPNYEESLKREKLVVAWLNEIEPTCSELFLMGDIFDFWFEYKKVVPKGYLRLLGKLTQMADSGISIYFFKGNHDMWVYDYFTQEIGMQIVSDELTIEKISKPSRFKLFIVFGLILFIVVWLLDKTPIGREQYATFTRPDGHYRVLVTRNKSWLGMMPGQASDSPGAIWLLDKNGNTLNQADVEMVQLVEHVDWLDKKVSIKLIADWNLPD